MSAANFNTNQQIQKFNAVLTCIELLSTVNATPFTECIDSCKRNANGAHPLAILVCQTMCWIITGGK